MQREQLEALTRASSASQSEVLRARIILLAASHWPNEEIAAQLQTTEQTVCKWRRRFARHGLAGLQDATRSGRPVRVSARTLNSVLTKVTQPPKGRARWSCRSMARAGGSFQELGAAVVVAQRSETAPDAHVQGVERPAVRTEVLGHCGLVSVPTAAGGRAVLR